MPHTQDICSLKIDYRHLIPTTSRHLLLGSWIVVVHTSCFKSIRESTPWFSCKSERWSLWKNSITQPTFLLSAQNYSDVILRFQLFATPSTRSFGSSIVQYRDRIVNDRKSRGRQPRLSQFKTRAIDTPTRSAEAGNPYTQVSAI